MKSLQESLLDIEGTEKTFSDNALESSTYVRFAPSYGVGSVDELVNMFDEIFDWNTINSMASRISKKELDKISAWLGGSGDSRYWGSEAKYIEAIMHDKDRLKNMINLVAVIASMLPNMKLLTTPNMDSGDEYKINMGIRNAALRGVRKIMSKKYNTKFETLQAMCLMNSGWRSSSGGANHGLNIIINVDAKSDKYQGTRSKSIRHIKLPLMIYFFD